MSHYGSYKFKKEVSKNGSRNTRTSYSNGESN